MLHLFGNILTSYGTAANNRGENEGNITSLQKIIWKGEVHTTVSAEAIRWALRYYWQNSGYLVNRIWNENAQPESEHVWQDINFDNVRFIDDDVLGFMRAEAAKNEISEESEDELQEETLDQNRKTRKAKSKQKPKGKTTARRGALEVTRAVSMIPFAGDITFNAVSGKRERTSLYGTEVHATRYQYGFALTPQSITEQVRINAILDGLISIGEVAGNHARFLYDFSPESIILRWTHDFSPRILYCFETDELGNISVPDLVRRIEAGDIEPNELWIGGAISRNLEDLGTHVFPGVKAAVAALKQVINQDLHL
jgi:CRISPR-associated protein Cst2